LSNEHTSSATVRQPIIAIDGYSACGKSTLAKAMAQQLGYRFIDTGAMYRMVTLQFLREEIDLKDAAAVAGALEGMTVDFVPGSNNALLNGEDVETEIRDKAVSGFVSPVAAVAAVRRWVVPQQQEMGKTGGIVMDLPKVVHHREQRHTNRSSAGREPGQGPRHFQKRRSHKSRPTRPHRLHKGRQPPPPGRGCHCYRQQRVEPEGVC
jgi:hypothetical protein